MFERASLPHVDVAGFHCESPTFCGLRLIANLENSQVL